MARLNHVKRFRGTSKTEDGNLTCGLCGDKIKKGDPYRWWANKTPGSRSGFRRNRCMKPGCRPRRSEYQTNSPHLAAIMDAEDSASDDISAWAGEGEWTLDGAKEVLSSAADGIREAASGYEESAEAMESGFGHATYQSDELREKTEELNSWADEIENTDLPDPPDEPDDPDDDEAIESWKNEVVDTVQDIVGQNPL